MKEAERFFAFVGRYVVGFQQLEDLMDEALLLCWPQIERTERAMTLGKWDFAKKVRKLSSLLHWTEVFSDTHREVLVHRIADAGERLEAERVRRNSLLHASFLFDFLLIGTPILRSYVAPKSRDSKVVHEYMDAKACDIFAEELGKTFRSMSMLHLQMIHALKEVVRRTESFRHENDVSL